MITVITSGATIVGVSRRELGVGTRLFCQRRKAGVVPTHDLLCRINEQNCSLPAKQTALKCLGVGISLDFCRSIQVAEPEVLTSVGVSIEQALCETSKALTALRLGIDNDLESLCLRGISEGLISVKNIIKLEAMRDQPLGVDLTGCDGFEEHRNGDGIDQPRSK
jgi:hypothetical protein